MSKKINRQCVSANTTKVIDNRSSFKPGHVCYPKDFDFSDLSFPDWQAMLADIPYGAKIKVKIEVETV